MTGKGRPERRRHRSEPGFQNVPTGGWGDIAVFMVQPPARSSIGQMGRTTDADEPAGTYSRTILNQLLDRLVMGIEPICCPNQQMKDEFASTPSILAKTSIARSQHHSRSKTRWMCRSRPTSRATLGVYELTRVDLLRDLYVWAYERSTQEYLAIKQGLAEPDPLRLAWRDFIRQTIREVITHPP